MTSQSKRETVLNTALEAVTKDRNANYGDPEDNFLDIARLWTAYKPDTTFNRTDVAVMMVLVKIARAYTSPTLLDHWTDLAGYAACAYGCSVADNEDAE
jgi:hypothetical protein